MSTGECSQVFSGYYIELPEHGIALIKRILIIDTCKQQDCVHTSPQTVSVHIGIYYCVCFVILSGLVQGSIRCVMRSTVHI